MGSDGGRFIYRALIISGLLQPYAVLSKLKVRIVINGRYSTGYTREFGHAHNHAHAHVQTFIIGSKYYIIYKDL